MKKISTLCIAAAIFALCSVTNDAKAQNTQGQVVVSAGMGWGLLPAFFNALSDDVKVVYPINAMVDYGLTDNFSVGGAYTYSSFAYNQDWSYTFTDGNGVQQTAVEKVDIKAVRQNVGIRPLIHFGQDEDLDLFTGARVGFTTWKYTDNSTQSVADESDIRSSTVSFQALFGVRTYFNEVLGAHFEVGIGTAPYFIAGGLSARF